MKDPHSHKLYYTVYFIISALLWLGYFYFTFTSPIDPENRYGLVNPLTVRLIQVSFIVPIMLIWAFGAYALNGLRKYIDVIKGAPEAKGLTRMAMGIGMLLFGLAFNSFIGAIRGHYNPLNYYDDVLGVISATTTRLDVLKTFTILTNYLSVFFTVVPYALMFAGAWALLKTSNLTADFKNRLFFPLFALGLVIMIYLMLFFQNPIRQVPQYPELGQLATYFLPDMIVILTIVIPYFIAWGLGLLAALATDIYKEKVVGAIYKEALTKFSIGFLTIVSTSILFQITGALGSAFINWSLTAILVLVYVLVGILGVGYIMFALGVKKLKKIETV